MDYPSITSRVCSCHFKDGMKENLPTLLSHRKKLCLDHYLSPVKRNKKAKKPAIVNKFILDNIPPTEVEIYPDVPMDSSLRPQEIDGYIII